MTSRVCGDRGVFAERIQAYIFVKQIGHGSYAAAWEVVSHEDGDHYVAKTISMLNMNERDRQNAYREISVLKSLSHPNIVSYKESFIDEEKDIVYIIQEFCDAGDLLRVINRRNGSQFNQDTIAFIACQVLAGLQYLHKQRIIHRDIKTENIFLFKDGRVKLGDFGLCRIMASVELGANTVCGTPNYFAPELCLRQTYDIKADIWSLGCVLFETLNLKRLFDGSDIGVLMQRISRFDGKIRIAGRYDIGLTTAVTQCLTMDPRKRPSAEDLLHTPCIWDAYCRHFKRLQQQPQPLYYPPPVNGRGTRANSAPPHGEAQHPTDQMDFEAIRRMIEEIKLKHRGEVLSDGGAIGNADDLVRMQGPCDEVSDGHWVNSEQIPPVVTLTGSEYEIVVQQMKDNGMLCKVVPLVETI